jgi:hypothetical protein
MRERVLDLGGTLDIHSAIGQGTELLITNLSAATFALSATASSGLAVSFSASPTTVCTVSGATVTLVGADTCTIQATQAGNNTYAAATSVSRSFQVTKASQTITFAAAPHST